MNMITKNMALANFNIVRPTITILLGQCQNTLGNVSFQNRLAVFRDRNILIYYVVKGAARLPVVLNAANILKSSPEGEGFSPNPREGQEKK